MKIYAYNIHIFNNKTNKSAACRAELSGIHPTHSVDRGHESVDLARDGNRDDRGQVVPPGPLQGGGGRTVGAQPVAGCAEEVGDEGGGGYLQRTWTDLAHNRTAGREGVDLPGNRHGHHGGEVVPPGPAQGSGGRAVKSDAVAGGTEQISNQDGGGLGSRSKGSPSGNDEAGARGRGGARGGSRGAKVRGEPLLFARDGGLSGR